MTTTYTLDLGDPLTVHEVEEVLARAAEADGLADAPDVRFARPGAVLRSDLIVSVSAREQLPFRHAVDEVFGFTPKVGVLFRPSPGADPVEQRRDMVRLTVAVLAASPGDAYLGFEGEITHLVRLGGKLVITPDETFWTPETEALLPPHDRADLPNL
jgi:hypothetical protein